MAKKDEKLPELKLIGERLAELRKTHGHSNYEHFAYELSMSRSAYWRLESGENFELKTLIKVCRFLGVTLKEFFDPIDFPKQVKKVKKRSRRLF